MEKKKIGLLISTVMLMLVLVFTATFAYFGMGTMNLTNIANLNVVTPTSMAAFTSYSNNSLSLSVELEDLMTVSPTPVSDTGDLIVKLSAPSANTQMFCTYDIRYIWDTTDQYTSPTMTLNSTYPNELSIAGSVVATGDSYSGYTYTSKNLVEKDLSQFSWTGNAGTIGRYTTLVSGAKIYSNTTTGTTATWTFTLNFYTLPSNQASLGGKNMAGHLQAANIVC